MRSIRILLAHCALLGAPIGLAFTAAGCGGSKETEVIKPAVPPTESGKDSMDFYKSQMKGGANKK